MKYKCIIVEDEPLAQKVLQTYIKAYNQLVLGKPCYNVAEAFEAVTAEEIQLVFLDINLPRINGMDFIRSLKQPPSVIFTTAYSEYAAASYELDAIDYLVKPITKDRFDKSIQKFLRTKIDAKVETARALFIKTDGQLVKIAHDDISYIEARKDYLMIHLQKGSYITHMTMKTIEGLLPANLFLRIHRSYIVSRTCVLKIAPWLVQVNNIELPIGKKYKEAIQRLSIEQQANAKQIGKPFVQP